MAKFRVICGDFREVSTHWNVECCNHIITDWPYGIADDEKLTFNGGIQSTQQAWGSTIQDIPENQEQLAADFADWAYRILMKNGNLLLFFDHNKPHLLKPLYDLFYIRNILIFVKQNPPPQVRKTNFRNAYESCAWFSKDKKSTFHFTAQEDMKNVVTGNVEPHKWVHPTEKPLWMCSPLITHFTNPGDLVVDPFAGVASIGEAALRLGRNIVCIDILSNWCEIAKERLSWVTGEQECELC
jgi:site-specific DNA-methyltransferase (adenine-specific)